jgi:hypothetical protein
MSFRIGVIAAIVAMGLVGCGTSPGERAATGAGIGAAGGAVGGALLGNPLAGAAVGGAAGAAIGGLTPPSSLDLGRPIWER